MKKQKRFNVAFTGDGLFLPIRNGGYYSIYHLMQALSKTRMVEPTFAHCYRGWENPKLFCHQPFNTLFFKPEDYYRDTGILNYAFSILNIQAVQILNAEEVLNLGRRLQRTKVKVIYEIPNIDYVLYGQLGMDEEHVGKMKRQQSEACFIADHVLCRSENDKSHLVQIGVEHDKVMVYRGAIYVKGIQFRPRQRKRFRIVFLGHMYYPPNENALKQIVTHVLPQLKKLDHRYNLTVIGIAPQSMVEDYSHRGVVFKGGVDNLSAELLRYDIAIAPLYEGSGTRLKILDHMASGMPIVTTTLGIAGLKESIARYVIIEDDIHRYANCIHAIMQNLTDYQPLMYEGRKFVETHYDWSLCLDPFLNIYQTLL